MLSREFCEVFKNTLFTEKHYMKIVQILSFFWFVFACISTEYRNLRSKSPYSVQIRENADQKKLRMNNFSPGDCFWISSNIFYSILGNFEINRKIALRQKCSNTELFLVRIFLYSDQKKLRIWTLSTQSWLEFRGTLVPHIFWNRTFTTEAFLEIYFVSLCKTSKIPLASPLAYSRREYCIWMPWKTNFIFKSIAPRFKKAKNVNNRKIWSVSIIRLKYLFFHT